MRDVIIAIVIVLAVVGAGVYLALPREQGGQVIIDDTISVYLDPKEYPRELEAGQVIHVYAKVDQHPADVNEAWSVILSVKDPQGNVVFNSGDMFEWVGEYSFDFTINSSGTHTFEIVNYGDYLANVRIKVTASPAPETPAPSELPNTPPTASFTYFPSSPTVDNTIQFTDQSTDSDGTIASWFWDFGDGLTSTLQNPTHQYSAAGTYTVTLTVTDDDGATNSTSQNITVTAINFPPTTNFTYSPGSPTTDDTIQFTDSSTDPDGTIVSWSWDFGDGGTSTLQNPTHQYSSTGAYTVTLTVTDDNGMTDNYSKSVTVATTEGLLAYWRFDEGSGTIAYDETTNNDGTIYGATWANGIFGKALSFDGVDDYVRVTESSTFKPTNSLTITAWIKPDATQNNYASIVSLDYRADGTWTLPFVAYELGASVGTGSSQRPWFRGWEGFYVTSPDALTPGEWCYVVGTFDGSLARLCVDGELKDSAAYTGSIHYGTSKDLAIGQRSPYSTGQFFKGLIDEIRIYNRALSADEILADYQAGCE